MRIPVTDFVAMFRRYDRELTCSDCRSSIARVQLRPFTLMKIRDTLGQEVTPLGGAVAMRAAELELADAGAGDVGAAQRRIKYLQREAGELVYALTCPTCGARYDRSLPDLTEDVRRSGDPTVSLV